MNWETGTDLNTLSCVKPIAGRNLQYSVGSSAQCSAITWIGGMEVGVREGDMCIDRAESLHCTADTNTPL